MLLETFFVKQCGPPGIFFPYSLDLELCFPFGSLHPRFELPKKLVSIEGFCLFSHFRNITPVPFPRRRFFIITPRFPIPISIIPLTTPPPGTTPVLPVATKGRLFLSFPHSRRSMDTRDFLSHPPVFNCFTSASFLRELPDILTCLSF